MLLMKYQWTNKIWESIIILAWLCNLSPFIYTEEAKAQRGAEHKGIGVGVKT